MFMTLAAVVVALALGHVAQGLAAAVRRHGWFDDWLRWLGAKSRADGAWHGRWGIALALSPPLLAVGLLQWALDAMLYGALGLLFGIGVLFYCWGPRDLDLDVDAIVDAPDAATRSAAIARLSPNGADMPTLVVAVFHAARRRWFGVLFWFLLLGPFGALLYRLAERTVDHSGEAAPPPAQAAAWRHLLAILDWPVAHLMTLALAVVGHFDAVYGAWRDWHAANEGGGFDFSPGFLDAAARVSVGLALHDAEAERREDDDADDAASADAREHQPPADAPAPTPVLHASMALVWRILVAWLVVLALFVLAGYV